MIYVWPMSYDIRKLITWINLTGNDKSVIYIVIHEIRNVCYYLLVQAIPFKCNTN